MVQLYDQGVMRWSHAMPEHPGAKQSLLDLNKWFYTAKITKETFDTIQAIIDACPCKASKQSDVRVRRVYQDSN